MAFSKVGNFAFTAGSGTISMAWPGGHAADDVGIIFISTRMNDVAVTKTAGNGSLLSAILSSNTTGTRRRLQALVVTAASGAEANIGFSDAGQFTAAMGAVFRGVAAPTDWLASTNGVDNNGGFAVHIPVGSPAANSVVVGGMATSYAATDDVGTWVNADLANVTEQGFGHYTSGATTSIYFVTGEDAPGGAIDDFTSTQTVGFSWTSGSLELVLTGNEPLPTLTDVDTDEVVNVGQTGVAITGADMGDSNGDRVFDIVQGTVEITQTETGTGTATAAALTIVGEATEGLKYGSANMRVTRTADSEVDSLAITVNPPTGHIYVTVGTPHADPDQRITSTPDIETDDQIEARGVGGGAVPTGLQLNTDGTFEFSPGNLADDFEVRIWDHEDFTWGDWGLQTIIYPEIEVPVRSYELQGFAPILLAHGLTEVPLGDYVFQGYAPTLLGYGVIDFPAKSYEFEGFAPTILDYAVIAFPVRSYELNFHAIQIENTESTEIPLKEYVFTGHAPSITAHTIMQLPTKAYELVGNAFTFLEQSVMELPSGQYVVTGYAFDFVDITIHLPTRVYVLNGRTVGISDPNLSGDDVVRRNRGLSMGLRMAL